MVAPVTGSKNISTTELPVRHCVTSVGIWSYSSLHFPAFGLNTEKCGPKSLRNPLPADHLRINKINNNPKRFVLVYPIFR